MPKAEKSALVKFLTEKIASHTDLNADTISPDKDLNEIGLTSLNIVLISGEVEDEFEIEIDPSIMFENKTINQVAEKIMQLNND